MTSERNSSLHEVPCDSIASFSVVSSTKTPRSPVTAYTRERLAHEPARNSKGQKYYYCSMCQEYSAITTTNLKRHLLSIHKIDVNLSSSRTRARATHMLHDLWKQACAEDDHEDVSEFERAILRKILNKDVSDQAMLNFIIGQNLSFRFVESKDFHAFCQALNPESKPLITQRIQRLIRK